MGFSNTDTEAMLSKLAKKKSGITRKATDSVNVVVKWPHEEIIRLTGDAADYNDLTHYLVNRVYIIIKHSIWCMYFIKALGVILQ